MRNRFAALVAALALCAVPSSAASLGGLGEEIFCNSFNFAKAILEKAPV